MATTPKPDMHAAIMHIHAVFCAATGVELRIGIGEYTRESAWFRYLQAGFTEDDLMTVVKYLKSEIKLGRRNPGALKFSNMIERLESFEEDRGLAKAMQRNSVKPITPKESVIRAMPTVRQGSPVEPMNAKPVGAYIAALRQAVG